MMMRLAWAVTLCMVAGLLWLASMTYVVLQKVLYVLSGACL